MDMTIAATRDEERAPKYFNGDQISVKKGQVNNTLSNYVNSRKYGAGRYVGSLVQIDSDRSVQALKFNQVNWLGGDPDDEESAGNFYFSPFANRWRDFMNYIHQKSAARDKKLAEVMKQSPELLGSQILERYPDPLEKYQKIFASILPGKKLLPIDPAAPKEFHFSDEDGQHLPFNPHFQFDFGIPTFQRPSASLLIGDRALSGRTEANTQWVKKKTSRFSSPSTDFSKSISKDRASPRMVA